MNEQILPSSPTLFPRLSFCRTTIRIRFILLLFCRPVLYPLLRWNEGPWWCFSLSSVFCPFEAKFSEGITASSVTIYVSLNVSVLCWRFLEVRWKVLVCATAAHFRTNPSSPLLKTINWIPIRSKFKIICSVATISSGLLSRAQRSLGTTRFTNISSTHATWPKSRRG